jgi:iron complex outermembrane receptor protein
MDSCFPSSQGLSESTLALIRLAARAAGWSLVALVVLGVFVGRPVCAAPQLQTFHIEAGEASLTLNEFSRQSSLQLLFDYSIVKGRRTRAVSGEYAAPAALEKMLADTGLVFDFVNERTLAVTVVSHGTESGSAVAEAPNSKSGHVRSAQTQSVRQDGSGSSAPWVDPKAGEPQEVIVTGTHVRGGDAIGEHVISLNRDDIETSGAATVQDFLRTLPQTFGGGPSEDTHYFSAETRTNSGIGTGINLRGLGARDTLVLIDGKRLAPSGTAAEFADIENIPLAAVDRIDILPDGASALYGADAVGGVVNFVMRDNFTGAESLARGGSGTDNSQREYQLAQTLGSHWDTGNAMASVEYYRRDSLPASARSYATSDLVPFGGSNFDTALSNPGTLLIGNQTYAIPRGQNGTALTAADLVAGTQNLSDKYTDVDLLPSQQRLSFYGSAKQALSDTVSVFGNTLVSQRRAASLGGGSQAQLLVPSSNPFYINPTGGNGPVIVDYNFLDDIGPAFQNVTVNDLNLTGGLSIDVGAAWKVSFYGNYAQEREDQFIGGQVGQAALAAALADPDPATAFNPFADGSHTNPATLKALAAGTRFYTDSRFRAEDVTADGPIVKLPGGAIKLALGADHRNQVFDTLLPPSPLSAGSRVSLSRNISAAFGEVTVPLFGKENGESGYRRLEFSVAGRYENYNGFGQAATPKFGVAWSPFDTVALRGTWGRSIRAPTPSDLDTSQNFVIPFKLPDKSSASGVSNVLIESGMNAGLTVERARSWTTGVDIDARQWATGLTFSATYFNINFRDRIEAPTFSADFLDNPVFASQIVRNPTPAQLASACSQGQYVSGPASACLQSNPAAILDVRLQNAENVRTQGLDFNASYKRESGPGTLKLSLDGTYLLHFTQQEEPGAPVQQLLDTQNNPIDLKMRGTVSWQQRRWGATVGVNFQNHYTDTVSDPNRPISSYTTFDTQLRYEFAPFSTNFLEHMRVELNATNVFNASPPFLNNQIAALGYDQENADPYGRLVSLQVRKTW